MLNTNSMRVALCLSLATDSAFLCPFCHTVFLNVFFSHVWSEIDLVIQSLSCDEARLKDLKKLKNKGIQIQNISNVT